MAGLGIKLNHAEMGKFLKSRQVRPPLKVIAEKTASRARGSAPVATGAYKASIDVESDTTDRAVERVVAHAPHAVAVESRTGNLKRALGG